MKADPQWGKKGIGGLSAMPLLREWSGPAYSRSPSLTSSHTGVHSKHTSSLGMRSRGDMRKLPPHTRKLPPSLELRRTTGLLPLRLTLLICLIGSSVTRGTPLGLNPAPGSLSQGSESTATESVATQGTAAEFIATKGTETEGTATEGTEREGTAIQGPAAKGTESLGIATKGTAKEGSSSPNSASDFRLNLASQPPAVKTRGADPDGKEGPNGLPIVLAVPAEATFLSSASASTTVPNEAHLGETLPVEFLKLHSGGPIPAEKTPLSRASTSAPTTTSIRASTAGNSTLPHSETLPSAHPSARPSARFSARSSARFPARPAASTRRSLVSAGSTPQCKTPASEPQTPLVWDPQPGKYLVMFCFRNQISNLIRCMHNHVLAAALLNRTLVVPEWILFSGRNLVFPAAWAQETSPNHLRFDLRVLWDTQHMKQCLGPRHVVTVDEYSASPDHPGPIRLSLIHCWFGNTVFCGYQDKAELNCPAKLVPLKGGTEARLIPDPDVFAHRFPFLDTAFLGAKTLANASCMPHAAPVDSFLKEYATPGTAAFEAPVLMVGELVNMQFVDKGGGLFPGGRWGQDPFTRVPGCANRLLIQPAQALTDQARELARGFFGGFPFVAVHWRRGDFLWYCDQQDEGTRGRCTYTAPQAASCIAALLKAHGISRVFVATNAAPREVIHFRRSLAQAMGNRVSIYHHVHLAPGTRSLRLLSEQGIRVEQQERLIGVTVDKALCALARLFLGSRESTFTQDIQRLRLGLGTQSSCDALVCQGQQEWDDATVLKATQEVELF